ncbi:MAG: exosome complex RNA-binding protein Rrp4 [Nitrosopumilaceae archaeon]
MENVKRKFVIPGDIITTGPLRTEQNVYRDDDKIIATSVGISEIFDNSVRVLAFSGIYMPRIDDVVIGKVVSQYLMSWELDINSCYVGVLRADEVFGRDFSPSSDDLKSKLSKGELVLAKIANFDRSRDPLLTVRSRELGKLESGELIKIAPMTIPRLIGKQGSMIKTIESATNARVKIGQNGLVVVSCEDPVGLSKTIKVIEMIDSNSHVPDLMERVKSFLESNEE